jgi:hypothetical protein
VSTPASVAVETLPLSARLVQAGQEPQDVPVAFGRVSADELVVVLGTGPGAVGVLLRGAASLGAALAQCGFLAVKSPAPAQPLRDIRIERDEDGRIAGLVEMPKGGS